MTYLKFEENRKRVDLSDFSFSKRVKFAAGKILAQSFPQRANAVEKAPFAPGNTKFDHLIRNGLYAEAFEAKDFRRLRGYLAHYWGEEASNFSDGWMNRFERMFLAHDVKVIEELEKFIQTNGDSTDLTRLYEIGCGAGQVLDYLATRLDNVTEFIGIDLGRDQILANSESCKNESISYHSADATQWIPENARPNSIFLTNGGVFEYFLQEELAGLFEGIGNEKAPAAIGIIETIAVDHDLSKEPDSILYGRELAFSHNYPALLRNAGFEIVHQSERAGESIDGGGRWIRILAVTQK